MLPPEPQVTTEKPLERFEIEEWNALCAKLRKELGETMQANSKSADSSYYPKLEELMSFRYHLVRRRPALVSQPEAEGNLLVIILLCKSNSFIISYFYFNYFVFCFQHTFSQRIYFNYFVFRLSAYILSRASNYLSYTYQIKYICRIPISQ
jgi:hypothetical protein